MNIPNARTGVSKVCPHRGYSGPFWRTAWLGFAESASTPMVRAPSSRLFTASATDFQSAKKNKIPAGGYADHDRLSRGRLHRTL